MVRFLGACEHAGIDHWCYSGDSGIGSAAYLYRCAAMAWMGEPNPSLFRMQPVDMTNEGPFRLKNNTVRVRPGPAGYLPATTPQLKTNMHNRVAPWAAQHAAYL